MRVCDKCGAPAAQNFELDSAVIDLCVAHVEELKAWLYEQKSSTTDKPASPAPEQTISLKSRSKAR